MAQAQRSHDQVTRTLKAQQRKLGLPQTPVSAEQSTKDPQPQWAQYPEHTITPVGEGPQGGFGEGFSAPSLQERVANAARAAQQAAQQTAQQAAQQAIRTTDHSAINGATGSYPTNCGQSVAGERCV